jgi:hypothetical protein
MGIDLKQRYLMDFVKVGRSGKLFYVFGAPEDLKGPYSSAKDAEKAYNSIIDNFEDYEVIDRKVRRKCPQ